MSLSACQQSLLLTYYWHALIFSLGKKKFISRFIYVHTVDRLLICRLYYKCGYSDDHKCPAKKYVQQQSNSYPPLFLVTLINEHTCDTLFRDNEPSSSSSGSQVLDFTKASLSPPLMAAASELKKDEEDGISVSMHRYSYSYDEY